jgi:hypothetical protein
MEGQAIDTDKSTTEEEVDETSKVEDVDEKVEPEMDLPSALVKLEEANRKIRDVNRESASRRKEIAELKIQLQNNGMNKDEVATKLTELQGQLKEANEKVRVVELRDRFDAVVAKAKIPFINQIANRDAFTFARDSISKLPDDSTDDDVLDVVKDVVKLRPHLLNKPLPPNINAEAKGASDAFAGLDMEGIARDFGITNR